MKRRLFRLLPVVLLPLLLGGCAEWVARWMDDLAYLHYSGRAYVMETHDLRRWIRTECRASLVREIEQAKLDGDEASIRTLLAGHYPGLVTLDAIRAARGDKANVLAQAPGCD